MLAVSLSLDASQMIKHYAIYSFWIILTPIVLALPCFWHWDRAQKISTIAILTTTQPLKLSNHSFTNLINDLQWSPFPKTPVDRIDISSFFGVSELHRHKDPGACPTIRDLFSIQILWRVWIHRIENSWIPHPTPLWKQQKRCLRVFFCFFFWAKKSKWKLKLEVATNFC